LKNFEGCICVISGLESCSISRLKKTWEAIDEPSRELFRKLKESTDTANNYKKLRAMFLNIVPPLVPFLAIYLGDLTIVEEGNPALVGDGMVNFQRYHQIASIIQELWQFQQDKYDFQPSPQILDWLYSFHMISDDDLYSLSLKLEPPARANV